MTEILRDTAIVRGTPQRIVAILEDPDALQRVMPGAESIVATGPRTFSGVLATRIQFLTVRADVEARLQDADPPHRLRLMLEGRPRGLAGSFRVSIPFEMTAADTPATATPMTAVAYSVDLEVTGRLATFGTPLLRDTFRHQIATLVTNVDRELAIEATRAE